MIEFGLGFLCASMVFLVIMWRTQTVKDSNGVVNSSVTDVLKSKRPDNRRARERRTVQAMNEMEESITKGVQEYHG